MYVAGELQQQLLRAVIRLLILSDNIYVFPVVFQGLNVLGLQEDIKLPPRIAARHAAGALRAVVGNDSIESATKRLWLSYHTSSICVLAILRTFR